MPLARWMGASAPWVMNFHGTYAIAPLEHWHTRLLAAATYRQAAGFLICSAYTEHRVRSSLQKHGLQREDDCVRARSRRLRLGIAPEHFTDHPGAPGSSILFVGGIKPRKGILELLRGYLAYRTRYGTAPRVVLIGTHDPSSTYGRRIEQFIHEHHMQDSVEITGHVDAARLQQAYAEAGAFVMLSRSVGIHFEGFGLVFLEANARGIPTIGSDDSGTAEAIDDDRSGYVVDADNPEDIAEKLHQILDEHRIQPEDCIAWAHAHSVAQQTDTIEALYRDVIKT